MGRRTSGLADRLRAAVERERASRSAEANARQDRLAEENRARQALFDELDAFGQATGFLEVLRQDDGVQLGWQGRSLRFQPQGEGEAVRVEYAGLVEGETQRLYREGALGGRWVWVRRRGAREDRLPLFDQGLELMLVHALDLPQPVDQDPPGPQAHDDGPVDAPPDAAPDARRRRL